MVGVAPALDVPESALPGTDGPIVGESGCALAAIAAAAIASGAVGPPDVGGTEGVFVTGADIGIAAAIGVGVTGALPTCCARRAASTAIAAPVTLPWGLSSPDFGLPEVSVELVVVVDWLAPLAEALLSLLFPSTLAGALALEPELEGPILAPLSESAFAGGELDALSLLFADAGLLLWLSACGLL
jgi:hypothetical protein